MSDEYEERLERLEAIMNKLTLLLPEDLRAELDEELQTIRTNHWERYMGEDL
jgi:hypothetical protein